MADLKYKHTVTFQQQADGSLMPQVRYDTRSLEQTLLHLLPMYWRWCMEGKPPYQHGDYGKTNLHPQLYYDSYHNSLEWVPPTEDNPEAFRVTYASFQNKPLLDLSKGHYRFNIQTSDGPDGDDWVRGTFRLLPHGEIEIIEKSGYYN